MKLDQIINNVYQNPINIQHYQDVLTQNKIEPELVFFMKYPEQSKEDAENNGDFEGKMAFENYWENEWFRNYMKEKDLNFDHAKEVKSWVDLVDCIDNLYHNIDQKEEGIKINQKDSKIIKKSKDVEMDAKNILHKLILHLINEADKVYEKNKDKDLSSPQNTVALGSASKAEQQQCQQQ